MEDLIMESPSVRSTVASLRRRFGPQRWLTVVSSVVGTAYRAAGMPPAEFEHLLASETKKRGRLIFHLRNRACMRLREALGGDSVSGGLFLEGGVAATRLHFPEGDYQDCDDCTFSCPEPVRTSLIIAGGLNRRLGDALAAAPPILRQANQRVEAVWRDGHGFTHLRLSPRWETLGLMPDWIAEELNLDPQRRHEVVPWFHPSGDVERSTVAVIERARPRPALRLIADPGD